MKNIKKGFTLIELLVVILIIGTLAAIALPQYQKAVLRSRAAEIWTLLPTIRAAAEEYCMANGGGYPQVEDLSIDFPSHWKTSAFVISSCSRFSYEEGFVNGLLFMGKEPNIADTGNIPADAEYVTLQLTQSGERICMGTGQNCRQLGFTKGTSYCDCRGCHESNTYYE